MAVTLAYDTTLSRVQITGAGLPGKTAHVQRSLNQVQWSTVRGGLAVPIEDGDAALDDYEFYADRVNWYRVTPHDYIAGFDADVAGWEPVGGASTLTHSTAHAHDGTGSALLTPDGVTGTVRARTTFADSPPVVEDVTYDLSVWVYRDAVGERDVDISVEFFDAADGTLEFKIWTTLSIPAATWTRIAGSGTAPSGAVKAQVNVNQRFTPAATDLLHVDNVELTPVQFPSESGSITPDLQDTVWLKSIAWPFLNRPVKVTDWSPVDRPQRGGLFDIAGRSVPVAVTDVRGSQRFTLEIVLDSPEAERDMDLIVAAGGTMFIHVPTAPPPAGSCPDFTVASRVPGGYVEIGDTTNSRKGKSGRLTKRFFALPCTVVAAPAPAVVGRTMTWGAVLALYEDWQNLVNSNPAWIDLLTQVADPDDLVQL